MPSYHCYFLDNEYHIRSTEVLETALLKDAIDLSLSMLKKRQDYKVEVWDGRDTTLFTNTPSAEIL